MYAYLLIVECAFFASILAARCASVHCMQRVIVIVGSIPTELTPGLRYAPLYVILEVDRLLSYVAATDTGTNVFHSWMWQCGNLPRWCLTVFSTCYLGGGDVDLRHCAGLQLTVEALRRVRRVIEFV